MGKIVHGQGVVARFR